jgi:hypothetical protein
VAAGLSVAVASLPLPLNAAQETGGNLDSIEINTAHIPAQGQALEAASLPVVLPVAQITTLTPPAAITNYAQETGGNLATIETNTAHIPAQGQALAAGCTPVVLPVAQISTLTPPAAITNYVQETGGNLATLAGAVSAAIVQENVHQINGQTPSLNAGESDVGTQRVVQASAKVLNITQVSVPITAGGIQVIAANANRIRVRVIQTSANPVWISTNATPTTANGAYLPGIPGYPWSSRFEGALYAISTGGAAVVTVDEESAS